MCKAEGLADVTVEQTGSDHLRVVGEYRGQPVVTTAPLTSSDRRILLNTRSDVRRAIRRIAGD
jgi:hypothetical protein